LLVFAVDRRFQVRDEGRAEWRRTAAHVLRNEATALEHRLRGPARQAAGTAVDMHMPSRCRYLALVEQDAVDLDRPHMAQAHHPPDPAQLRKLGLADDGAAVHRRLDGLVDALQEPG